MCLCVGLLPGLHGSTTIRKVRNAHLGHRCGEREGRRSKMQHLRPLPPGRAPWRPGVKASAAIGRVSCSRRPRSTRTAPPNFHKKRTAPCEDQSGSGRQRDYSCQLTTTSKERETHTVLYSRAPKHQKVSFSCELHSRAVGSVRRQCKNFSPSSYF